MTKKKNDILLAGSESGNPENSEIITPQNPEARLLVLEQQIAFGYIQMSIAIKTIRDEKLYLVCGYDSMQSYGLDRLNIMPAQLYRHLKIADSFNEKVLKKLSHMPMTALLKIAQDSEITEAINTGEIDGDRVVYADGTSESLTDALERARAGEQKKVRKKLEDAADKLSAKDRLIEDYQAKIGAGKKKIDDLNKTIQDLATRKDIDPEKLVFITQKREAVDLLEESEGRILQVFGSLGGIPHELLDPELTARLARLIASLEAGVQRIREQYGAAVWIPGEHERPGGLVPE